MGTHSSSRVDGRAVARGARPYRARADAAAAPRASIVAAEPGAIVDSSTSNRSTAKRTGAFGSTGGADGAAEPVPAPATADRTRPALRRRWVGPTGRRLRTDPRRPMARDAA